METAKARDATDVLRYLCCSSTLAIHGVWCEATTGRADAHMHSSVEVAVRYVRERRHRVGHPRSLMRAEEGEEEGEEGRGQRQGARGRGRERGGGDDETR